MFWFITVVVICFVPLELFGLTEYPFENMGMHRPSFHAKKACWVTFIVWPPRQESIRICSNVDTHISSTFLVQQIPVEFQKNLTGTIQQKATGILELIRPAWHRSKQSGKQKSLHSLTLAASEPICHAQWPQEPLRMAPKPLKTTEYLNKANLDWCSKDDKRDPKTIA